MNAPLSQEIIFDFSETGGVFHSSEATEAQGNFSSEWRSSGAKEDPHGIVPQRYGLQAHLLSKIVRCGASQKYPTWDSTTISCQKGLGLASIKKLPRMDSTWRTAQVG